MMATTKTTFSLSLQNRLVILAAVGALVMACLAFWTFAHLDRVKSAAEFSDKARVEYGRKIDKLKSDFGERQLALVELRGADSDDQIASLLHKVDGLTALVGEQVGALAVNDTSAVERDLKFHATVYNAAAHNFADTLRLGRYIGAADRIMTNTLAKEYVILLRLSDRLRADYEAKAQNTADVVVQRIRSTKTWAALLFLCGLVLMACLPLLLFGQPVNFLRKIIQTLDKLRLGEISKEQLPESTNEVGAIAKGINAVSAHLSQSARFADDVGRGVFDSEFKLAGQQDVLGAALVEMRDRLRTVAEDEKRRNWAIAGFARFGEILRANHDLQALADQMMTDLTHYIDAIQGGFFIAEENDEGVIELRLISSYAYERKKYIEKTFRLGEGLVGQAALERGAIYVTEVPANYVTITSGLGQANPRALLVTPLIANNELFGVLEFAAFQEFPPHVVEFVERMAENIASTLTNVRNNERTVKLLKASQELTGQLSLNEGELRKRMEEAQSQEEEIRQNAEEMAATQEEMARMNIEMEGRLTAINRSSAVIEFDMTGHILTANDNFLQVMGYRKEEIIGKHHSLFVTEADKQSAAYQQFWEKLRNGVFEKGEFERIAKDGTAKWLFGSYNPILGVDGKPYKVIKFVTDITEQKAQEAILAQALEESQSQEEEIRQNAEEMAATQEEMARLNIEMEGQLTAINRSSAVIEFDMTGHILTANDNFLQVMGYRKEEIVGKHNSLFVTEADKQSAAYQQFWENLRGGVYQKGEFERVAKGNAVKWLFGSYNPIIGVDGKPYKVIKFVTDITEQKAQEAMFAQTLEERMAQALEEVQAQEEEIRQNAEEIARINLELKGQIGALNNAALVSEADLLGNIINVNDTFCRVAKYSREELIGRNHRMLKSGHQSDDIFVDLWQTIAAGQVWRGLIKNKAKDGTYYWVQSTITPVLGQDGKPYKYVGVRFEVTDQIEAKHDTGSVRDLTAVAAFSPDLICVLDADGCILEINPAFTQHLGYAQADLIGRSLLEFVHEGDRDAGALELHKLGRERYATQFMHRFRRPDGTYVYLSWGMVSDPDQGLAHAVGRDVTELLAHSANGNGAHQLMSDMKKQLAAARKTAGYLELNEKGYLQGVSDMLLRRLGYKSYELVGLHLTALFSEADRPMVQTHLQQNGVAETFDQRLVLRTKDGAGVVVHAVLNYVHAFNGMSAMYVGFVELLN